MPKPRDEEEDLFHDVADVEFVDGEEETSKPKRKAVKKKTAKKKVAKKKAAPKRGKKAAAKKADLTDEPKVSDEGDTGEQEKSDDSPAEQPAPKRSRRKSIAPAEVEIAPRKKKPVAKKKTKTSRTPFGAGLGLEPEAEAPADKAAPADDRSASEAVEAATTEAAAAPLNGSGDSTSDKASGGAAKEGASKGKERAEKKEGAEKEDEYGRPEPVANYVVHIYELGRLRRTVERDFTPEMAEAYATEFSRAAKHYGRSAVAGKKDTQPATMLD